MIIPAYVNLFCFRRMGFLDSLPIFIMSRFRLFVTMGDIFLPPWLVIELMYESSVLIPTNLCDHWRNQIDINASIQC